MRCPFAVALSIVALAACGGRATSASSAEAGAAPADPARPMTPAPVYFEFQVESPVRPVQGSCAPAYPDSLRTAGTTGEVVGQFIVDTRGQPEVESFKVLRSSHEGFTAAVREALACMRFTPARIRGGAVRQLVQQPFEFRAAR